MARLFTIFVAAAALAVHQVAAAPAPTLPPLPTISLPSLPSFTLPTLPTFPPVAKREAAEVENHSFTRTVTVPYSLPTGFAEDEVVKRQLAEFEESLLKVKKS